MQWCGRIVKLEPHGMIWLGHKDTMNVQMSRHACYVHPSIREWQMTSEITKGKQHMCTCRTIDARAVVSLLVSVMIRWVLDNTLSLVIGGLLTWLQPDHWVEWIFPSVVWSFSIHCQQAAITEWPAWTKKGFRTSLQLELGGWYSFRLA